MNYNIAHTNTDKFIGGLFKNGLIGHNYQLLYKNFLQNNPEKILEIGTAHGGFAKFLRENLVKSFIVGADIAPDNFHNHVSDHTNNNNLYDDFFVGNAFSEEFLSWLNKKEYTFDFVIEDADHSKETQQYMLNNFHRFLSEKGVYVCEDIQTYEIAVDLIKQIPLKYRAFSYIWDGRYSVGRCDDICIVVDLR